MVWCGHVNTNTSTDFAGQAKTRDEFEKAMQQTVNQTDKFHNLDGVISPKNTLKSLLFTIEGKREFKRCERETQA
ncbi:unnamed protein product [Rotaria sp. Silwood2]|nr:unnamed protein product [Rotaria sp. Silwood2]CAF3285571.1 unnamed protein product [Rotaria sp. Silwood2]CAF4172384.1 unnamed protein product [Rotaria sp. Silwood2]